MPRLQQIDTRLAGKRSRKETASEWSEAKGGRIVEAEGTDLGRWVVHMCERERVKRWACMGGERRGAARDIPDCCR